MNSKRGRKLIKIELKPIEIHKRQLTNLEKIMRKRLKSKDFTVTFKRKILLKQLEEVVISSARYMQHIPAFTTEIEVASRSPNVWVVLSKRRTTIGAQRIYDKGESLAKIEEAVRELEKYIKQQSL